VTRVLIIVQNLPVPFDRRVWLERQALIADQLMKGEWKILGVVRTDLVAPDWFCDPVTGRRSSPDRYAFQINHRSEEQAANVKQVWEISRLQYLATFRSRGSSANNHVIAETAGQLVACCAFPWFPESERWRRDSARLLGRELLRNTGKTYAGNRTYELKGGRETGPHGHRVPHYQ